MSNTETGCPPPKISVMIPCYNEEENVREICAAVKEQLELFTQRYDYEILFIDNCSTDRTEQFIEELCRNDKHVKAIFNSKNFGQFNSPYHGMLQTTGNCTITMCADFQDPPQLIPKLIEAWEEGYKVVCAIKTSSKENKFMYWLRSCYYKTIKKISDVEQIEHFTGFGLYDKSFINVLRELKDPTPFLRGIVAELGPARKDISYEQQKRRAGKTSNNFYKLFDAAMLSFTSYTKLGLRLATFAGILCSIFSFLIAIFYLVMKLLFWDIFNAGMAPLIIGLFFLGGIQLFFIGLLGEYIMSINTRIMNRPLVIENRRINFTEKENN